MLTQMHKHSEHTQHALLHTSDDKPQSSRGLYRANQSIPMITGKYSACESMCTAVQHRIRCTTTELLRDCLFLLFHMLPDIQ